MYAINHTGLTKKQTYEDIIEDVVGRKTNIKYPNRDAQMLRESPTIINLLDLNGNSGLQEMDKFNKKQIVATELASVFREESQNGGGSHEEVRATMARRYRMDSHDEFTGFNRRQAFNGNRPAGLPREFEIGEDYQSVISDFESTISDEIFQHDQMEEDQKDKSVELVEDGPQNLELTTAEQLYKKT